MQLILSSDNVVEFLKQHKVCPLDFQAAAPIVCKEGTNFNLVVKSADGQNLLVKQNRLDSQGQAEGSLPTEWVVQALIDSFGLTNIQPLISQVLLLDWSNCTLVSVFYDDYCSLDRFYYVHRKFPPHIPHVFGMNLGKIHQATYQQSQHREFVGRYLKLEQAAKLPRFIQKFNNLDPSIFATVCPDGLNFYKLYQRFPSLNQAVMELYSNLHPACLIHNDLTLDNFIVDLYLDADSTQIKSEQIKIIDWERSNWGDPAVDLGMVVAEYVGGIWLGNLVVDRHLDLNTMLSLAAYPLESLVPSLRAFLQGYLTQFPQIIAHRPDFIRRVVQFAGIGILDRLSYYVEHHYYFQNNSLCKLQVAKNLLCHPQQGITTIFGATEAELIEDTSNAA
jgi:hypothetical protein